MTLVCVSTLNLPLLYIYFTCYRHV